MPRSLRVGKCLALLLLQPSIRCSLHLEVVDKCTIRSQFAFRHEMPVGLDYEIVGIYHVCHMAFTLGAIGVSVDATVSISATCLNRRRTMKPTLVGPELAKLS